LRKSQARNMVTRKVTFHYLTATYHLKGDTQTTEVILSTEESRRLTKLGLKKKLHLPDEATVLGFTETKTETKLLALDLETFIELSVELEDEI